MKVLAILNPRAGHGRAGRLRSEIEARLEQLGVGVEILETARQGHGAELVADADLTPFGGVLACGGDGTLFEVVNGCFANPAGPAVPIGIVPIGTGNAFARDLDLVTGELEPALERVAAGRTREVDVGHCRAGEQEFHFVNILGLGFVSDVTCTAAALKALGNVSYTLGVVYRTLFLGTTALRLRLDDVEIERDAVFLEISNSRYTADFLMAPDAAIDDGLLDVTLLGRISRTRLLRLFPTVFRGEHVRYPEVETFQVRTIEVLSAEPKKLTPDGEILGTSPARVRCLRGAISVFA